VLEYQLNYLGSMEEQRPAQGCRVENTHLPDADLGAESAMNTGGEEDP
jgi:hypothetical protein